MPQQFKTLSLTTSLLNPCTLHSCMQKGVFQRQIWISHPPPHNGGPLMISRWYAHVQCCSPSPAYTAIMQTHSTHTHSRAEFGSNKGDQVLLTATITPLEKKATIMFLWCGKSVVVWWRPQHGENRLFILDQTFIGVLALLSIYSTIPSKQAIWTRLGWLYQFVT